MTLGQIILLVLVIATFVICVKISEQGKKIADLEGKGGKKSGSKKEEGEK